LTRETLILLLRIQRYIWRITTPHCFPLSLAQVDRKLGIPATDTLGAICCSRNAASPGQPATKESRTGDPPRNKNDTGVVLRSHPFVVNHTFNATPTEKLQQY